MRTFSSLALAIAFCCAPALATDYYVDLGAGNDAGAGTIGDPWRTLTHAMATVPIVQGHRVLVRGVANTSSPGETFPIRVGAGISLGTWDAQNGATIDAGSATCIELVGPAHRVQSVRGIAGNLELRGEPALFVPVLADFESVELQVEDCRLVGGFTFDFDPLPPGIQRYGRCVVAMRRCSVVGDVTMWMRSSYYSFSRNILQPTLIDNEIQGTVLLRRVFGSLPLEYIGNRVTGDFLLQYVRGQSITVRDNVVSGALFEIGGTARAFGNPILVERNQSAGDLTVNGSGPLQVLDNRAGGDLDVYGSDLAAVNDNVVGGHLAVSAQPLLAQPCAVLRNDTGTMRVDYIGEQALTVAENTLRSTLEFGWLPHAAVEIRANRITCSGGEDGIRFATPYTPHIPGAPLVTLEENRLSATTPAGSGIRSSMLRASLFACSENTVHGFATGFRMDEQTVMNGTPSGRGFRIERNHFRANAVGLDVALGGSQEDLRMIGNVVEGGTQGFVLTRGAYLGTVRMWNNILAFHSGQDVAAAFAPIDRVQWNLAADGSLLARDLTNISGDPHFADRAAGDVSLLPSSPAVGSGVDPQTLELGFNMGLDALAPAASLSFRTLSPGTGSLRFAKPSATVAVMVFALEPAYPAAVPLCDGRLGLSPASWIATVPASLQGGAVTIPFALPAGPWTVAVQALYDAAAATPPCGASNTVIVQR